jgi:hypothetical protein
MGRETDQETRRRQLRAFDDWKEPEYGLFLLERARQQGEKITSKAFAAKTLQANPHLARGATAHDLASVAFRSGVSPERKRILGLSRQEFSDEIVRRGWTRNS